MHPKGTSVKIVDQHSAQYGEIWELAEDWNGDPEYRLTLFQHPNTWTVVSGKYIQVVTPMEKEN